MSTVEPAGSPQPVQLPQPDDVPQRERDDAMGAYLMMFAAWAFFLPLPILNLIASIIYFFVNKRRSRFVAFHSLQSLLSQIGITAVNVVAVAWLARNLIGDVPFDSRFWGYLIFAGAANLSYIVVSFVALGRARRGRMFYMPLVGGIAYDRYFGEHAVSVAEDAERNQPPSGR